MDLPRPAQKQIISALEAHFGVILEHLCEHFKCSKQTAMFWISADHECMVTLFKTGSNPVANIQTGFECVPKGGKTPAV